MANPEHLAILKQGVKVWNEWRKENRFTTIDLRGVNLHGADLDYAVLREVNLGEANLGETSLMGVNFIMAQLGGADLIGAECIDAEIVNADLRGAKLNEANFYRANLQFTKLSGADLRGADLTQTNLNWATLDGADLSGTILGLTDIGAVDLSAVNGLQKVKHEYSSIIGIDTIYKSRGNIPEVFLRGCGIPEDMITYARSLRGKAFGFYSCFISHSAKDKRFCEQLYADLQAKGVRVWLFEEDAKWGEPVWGEIDRSIKVYDKLIVVCSENSLKSSPVNREIERALTRGDKEGKGILFPIRIDDYIFDTWEHERKADVLRKVVGDFSGWDKDAARYDKAFDKLLKGLQAA